jgi:hypothetical protein
MIGILCENEAQLIAQAICGDLAQAYHGQLQVTIIPAHEQTAWSTEPVWDDLLIVLYDTQHFPEMGKRFIQAYLDMSDARGYVLPVALHPQRQRPPEPISHLKAILYDDTAKGTTGRIARRVGALLGLRLRRGDTKVFISYRAVDGSAIAQQLEAFLHSHGFNPWRDEAQDADDGDPNIQGGENVQTVLDTHLRQAALILLVDTPEAPASKWIKFEIDTANAQLLPILPVCCRDEDDRRHGPRFRSLMDLQRWVEVTLRPHPPAMPLEDTELDRIMDEMESYLCEIYRRKSKIPYEVSKQFRAHDFAWTALDDSRRLYQSLKRYNVRIRHQILLHCSIFDEVYTPALQAFVAYAKQPAVGPQTNFRLFIYGGEVLPELEIEELYTAAHLDDEANLIVLHHQELLHLLASDFKRLSP